MKRNVTLTIAMMTLIFVASCGDTKNQQNPKTPTPEEMNAQQEKAPEIAQATFSDEMAGKVFRNYQQIRIALVNSNAEEATKAAGNLVQSVSGEKEEMKSIATAMAEVKDLEKQRALFSQLTEKVEPLFKGAIAEGAIYKQFCPMAFEGNGGYWISDMEEIRNPYYGDKMLKCGKVAETIKQ
jgi:hypothetical protein